MQSTLTKQQEIENQNVIYNQNVQQQNDSQTQSQQGKNNSTSKILHNQKLLNLIKNNQLPQFQRLVKRSRTDLTSNDKKKWNFLIWASFLGHTKMVKILFNTTSKDKSSQKQQQVYIYKKQYLQPKPQYCKVILGQNKQMRANPLHWSSFQNHFITTQYLLKIGVNYLEIDSLGNNSLMLAAAGGAQQTFKIYLMFGVQINCVNTRGHGIKDLTSNQKIISLTNKYIRSKQCYTSKVPFAQKQIKYYCWVCTQFHSKQYHKNKWIVNEQGDDIIDGRCLNCWKKQQQLRKQIQDCINSYDQIKLSKVLNDSKDKHSQLPPAFLLSALQLNQKLKWQNKLKQYVSTVQKIPDYKQILKSVNQLKKMLKQAEQQNLQKNKKKIELDQQTLTLINNNIHRLNAERDLRFQIDNCGVGVGATRQGVAKFKQLLQKAQQYKVSQQYLDVAKQIVDRMQRSILAQDTNILFANYPPRPQPYPQPLKIDFKTKRPIDPATKKPTDPNNLLPKKKKITKKNPGYIIPEWAADLATMNQKIKVQQSLLQSKQQLGLQQQFVNKASQLVLLMKKQSGYRKDINTLQAMVDQANKKNKKK